MSDWIFAKKNQGPKTGVGNNTIYNFSYTSLLQNNTSVNQQGFTNGEFSKYFELKGYTEVLTGTNSKISSLGTIHIFNK